VVAVVTGIDDNVVDFDDVVVAADATKTTKAIIIISMHQKIVRERGRRLIEKI